MAYMLSPGVTVLEKDLTDIVPAVSSSKGAFSGAFTWGPVMSPMIISNEAGLVATFGKPDNNTFTSFFSAANFLEYSNFLYVNRQVQDTARNASSNIGGISAVNVTDGGSGYTTVTISLSNEGTGSGFSAEAVVVDGIITDINVLDPGIGYPGTVSVVITDSGAGSGATATVVQIEAYKVNNLDQFTLSYETSVDKKGVFAAKYPGLLGNSVGVSMADSATFAAWDYAAQFEYAPLTTEAVAASGGSNDELHVIVYDVDGKISGTAGTVLERYAGLSKSVGTERFDGTANHYKAVLNSRSRWVWAIDTLYNWGGDKTTTFEDLGAAYTVTLGGAVDGNALAGADIQNGWDVFENSEVYDVNLLPLGGLGATDAKWVVDNLVLKRRDCMAFISPPLADVLDVDPVTAIKAWKDTLAIDTSYAVIDTGWKYQYDRYNAVYRWVPLNADVAGLCAHTDAIRDPWWSPAGFNRGFIRNVVKLAYNPKNSERDALYPLGINPVVTFPGSGTVLYGDRTAQLRPSAFDRINVRRLFIVLGKAVATAAKYKLFEFNDEFTRASFRAMIEPYLEDIRGRRGLTDYLVKCDAENNTPEVIDRNEFVADIYVKPARSINFIKLTLVATRTGVQFEEVIGA